MASFMDSDFLLTTDTAKALFKNGAEHTPIFDWHCHLSPKEIYENKTPSGIVELWLGGDHYKWRAMRSMGIEEKYITGSAPDREKFRAYAKTVSYAVGNPLCHWTHLELQRYFNIYTPLNENTADEIFDECNKKIASGGFTPRELIASSNVKCVCTTDDAADSLEYHALLKKENLPFKVLPAFRPDKALSIEAPGFIPWLSAMEKVCGMKINSFSKLKEAMKKRIDFFNEMGCRASDHGFGYFPYSPATEEELEEIFSKGIALEKLTVDEADKYRTALMQFLAGNYHDLGWGMELHIGAMRNNNARMFSSLGADTGFDSIDDREIAFKLSRFLDSLDKKDKLPKTILFNLNPKDNYVFGSMLGNFQSDETAGKIQFGSAWWFNDNYDGMREQMKTLMNLGVIGKFVGMVTDSRSFLSYPRHEYFRRILCELFGDLVEEGKYPKDIDFLSKLVEDISFNNAWTYFGME
ncbi:MAG: glucuronate isomerase [Ruminococcaceae bacterium]|jgi:glucuronate isomerase|nr:glucuronate isomerase [Oscillospiraceae bacterium]